MGFSENEKAVFVLTVKAVMWSQSFVIDPVSRKSQPATCNPQPATPNP